ncbi:MAG TPA: TasA family protein [Gaiellaceae bacterium]|nr:TasA family protein [Gaiellaceae bacterium]
MKIRALITRKIGLTAAAVCAVSVAAAGGTYASFTATPVSISSNSFAAGTLEMSRSGSGAVLSAGAMAPGDEADGSVTITNTGSLAGDYELSGEASGDLADALELELYKDDDGQAGAKLYDGSLADFDSVDLGVFAADGGSHTFYFHVSFPSTGSDAGDNALQGTSASATFTWSATQA